MHSTERPGTLLGVVAISPLPPMARLLQMELVDLGEGTVEVCALLDDLVSNPVGVVHGGLVSAVRDTVAGWAVQLPLE